MSLTRECNSKILLFPNVIQIQKLLTIFSSDAHLPQSLLETLNGLFNFKAIHPNSIADWTRIIIYPVYKKKKNHFLYFLKSSLKLVFQEVDSSPIVACKCYKQIIHLSHLHR